MPPQDQTEKQTDTAQLNRLLARANAEAAELLAEIEEKNDQLRRTNETLSRVNAEAAELLAELEEKSDRLSRSNRNLARANARSAELVAQLQARREELEWTNTSLKQANEEKQRILSVAAHDIRSGMGGIRGFAELLHTGLREAAPETREQAELIRTESTRLLELLESLLDESSHRMGRVKLHKVPLDLLELVDDAVRLQGEVAAKKGQRLEVLSDGFLSTLDADPVRIRQVVDNLLSNAIKYAPPGSTITVELSEEGERAGVAILDQGPGLTAADLEGVFGEFARLSAQPTGGESSHGLGLSIVKKIVELHDGKVSAGNRKDGTGARFGFELPVATAGPRSCRILMVDDQALQRKLAEKLLTDAGHRVMLCRTGQEALEAVSGQDFNLVLMDVEMPEMDGREAARRIRALGKDEEHLPIIAMTGHSDPVHLSKCLEAGMNDTITKPFDSRLLAEVLRKWVPRGRGGPRHD